MPGKPVGTIFVELDLDVDRYTKSQQRLLKDATTTSLNIEQNFKNLGMKSAAEFDLMRAKIQNSYDMIANSSKATANDIVRAEEAKNKRLLDLNRQQFGENVSFIDTLKKHWIAAAASIYGAWALAGKALEYVEIGAKALQVEESFRLVAKSANESGDAIIAAMKRASAETIDDSDMMQKAVKGMVLGLSGEQLIRIMEAARISARVAGEDVKTAYENITEAIATGMPGALKRYGLISKEEMSLVDKALKAGVEGVDLYKIAMMNAGIQAAKYGEVHTTMAERLQKDKVTITQFHEDIGKVAVEVYSKMIDWGQRVINQMDVMEAQRERLRRWGTGGGGPVFHGTVPPISAGGTQSAISAAQEEKSAAVDALKKAIEAEEARKKALQEREAAEKKITESIRKADIEIESYRLTAHEKELNRINSEAKAFEKVGVDKKLIAQFIQKETQLATNKLYDETKRLQEKSEEEFILGNYKRLQDIYAAKNAESEASKKAYEDAEKLQREGEEKFILANYERLSSVTKAFSDAEARRAEIRAAFALQYEELGKSTFDIERDRIQKQAKLWEEAGADKVRIAEWTAKKVQDISRQETVSRISFAENAAGMISNTFRQIAEAGGKHSEDAFRIYQAFAIVETGMAAAKAIVMALASPPGPPWSYVTAAVTGAMAATQIALIAAAKPPKSYDEGGISTSPGVYYAGIPEAHIPLRGGRVPVEVSGGRGNTFIVHMENPVFQDQETQRQVFVQLAAIVARGVAADAVAENYENDGRIRQMIRSRR